MALLAQSRQLAAASTSGRVAGTSVVRPFRAASAVRASSRRAVVVRAAAATDDLGFKTMRAGIKEAGNETILTPRFYTTGAARMRGSRRARALASPARLAARLAYCIACWILPAQRQLQPALMLTRRHRSLTVGSAVPRRRPLPRARRL